MTYRVPAFTDEENDRAVAPLAYSYTVVRVAPNGDDTPVSVSEIRTVGQVRRQAPRRPRQPQSDFSGIYVYSVGESTQGGVSGSSFCAGHIRSGDLCAVYADGW